MRRILALLLLLTAALAAADKVAPEVRVRAGVAPRLEVFILLAEQPQREIVERVESGARLRLDVAEGNYRRAAGQLFAPESLLARYRDELDQAVVETRQAAFREIEARIGPAQESMERRLAALGAARLKRYRVVNMIAADLPAEALAALEADPEVAEILPIEQFDAALNVSVPALGAPAFWERGYTGAGQAVAVLDSGVRASHPVFSGRQVIGRVFGTWGKLRSCFSDDADSVDDMDGHGTHVAGIVASQGTSTFPGALGVAKGLGTLYSLKVGFLQKYMPPQCNGGVSSNSADVLDAIDWALANTAAKIFNYSYGGKPSSDDSSQTRLFDGVVDAFDVVLVTSAGNEGPGGSTVGDPAIGYNVIAVANFDDRNTVDRYDDRIHPSSSRGPTLRGRYKPDVAAPGTNILSAAYNSDGLVEFIGTSMAAPHVAGAAALLRQSGVTSPLGVKAVLINTADGTNGWSNDWGWGAVNLNRTLTNGFYVLGSVGPGALPGAFKLYRGYSSGDLKASLVWKRHASATSSVASAYFHDLNLLLYSRMNGAVLTRSEETIQNVEQVVSRATGDVVLKVVSVSSVFGGGITTEPFALAFSESNFQAATGPLLALQCTAPQVVAPGSTFSVSCEAANNGDLEAYGVEATADLPAGFRGGTAQSLGTLAARSKASLSVSLTASAAAGRFPVTVNLTSASFGETFRASGQVVVATTTTLPALSVSPAALTFDARLGGAAPGPATLRVSNPGAGVAFTAAASSSGWLAVTPASGTAPADLGVSVNTQRLAAGVYSGAITVTARDAANSPQTINVTLNVTAAPTIRLTNKLMTKAVAADSGCQAPEPASVFLPTDREALVWFLVDGAQAGDRVTNQWIAPNGSVQSSGSWSPLASGGSWCMWGSLAIAGKPPASTLGNWKARVFWNGAELFTLSFDIAETVTVRQKLMTKDPTPPTGGGCPIPSAATEFLASDTKAMVWFLLAGTKPDDRAKAEWYSPDGRLHTSSEWDPLVEGGERCFWAWLNIAGERAASLPGQWTVKVSYNGALIFSLPFRIVPSFGVEKALTARTIPTSSGCPEPDAVADFTRRDARAYLWFLVNNAQAGDRGGVEFYQPSGEQYYSYTWEGLERGGSWCFRASILIAYNPPATMLGDWEARVIWNGEAISRHPFRILPVEVADRMTAKSLPDDYRCGAVAPTPVTSFRPTDPQVLFYVYAKGAEAEERPRAEWVAPNGETVLRSVWNPLANAGNYCFRSALNLAGASAAGMPGEWNVKFYWNDLLLFSQPFTIAEPAGEGGASGTANRARANRPASREDNQGGDARADAPERGPAEIP